MANYISRTHRDFFEPASDVDVSEDSEASSRSEELEELNHPKPLLNRRRDPKLLPVRYYPIINPLSWLKIGRGNLKTCHPDQPRCSYFNSFLQLKTLLF
jgi:hypothetical protein